MDLDGVESADDAPDTSYYQWVTFMFAIQVMMQIIFGYCILYLKLENWQAAVFFFPYKLWKNLEGGLMASFGTDGKSPVIIRMIFSENDW